MRTRKIFYLTIDGLRRIKKEYALFKKAKITRMKGDVPPSFESDAVNSDYLFFLEEVGLIDKKIEELEEVMENAKVISVPPKEKQDIVHLGAKIILEGKDEIRKLWLVGTAESDPNKGRISNESPFGKALLGRRVGDEINLGDRYTIKKIAYNS